MKRPKKTASRRTSNRRRATADDQAPETPHAGARRVPVKFDEAGNMVEVEQPKKETHRGRLKRVTPPDQFAGAYVPGRTYVHPKTGTKHEDH